MKSTKILILLCVVSMYATNLYGQVNTAQADTTEIYLITKNDGSTYIGNIISQNAREVHLNSRELGELIIPKHEIKEIRKLDAGELNKKGALKRSDPFKSRHFITTNGYSIAQKEAYVIWNIYGPDIQYGISDRVSVGLLTTWFGVPILGTFKYSIPVSNKFNAALGIVGGTGSWAEPEYGVFLPYASFTVGSARNNLTLAGSYGALFGDGEPEDRIIFSIGGSTQLNDRFSLVFDSILIPETDYNTPGAVLIPGLRLSTDPNKAFQIGFAAIAEDGELLPFPVPMLQWFRRF